MLFTRLNRTLFILSVAVLGFFYGVASETFGWFPSAYLDRAFNQARVIALQLQTDEHFAYFRRGSGGEVAAGSTHVVSGEVQKGATLVASRWESFGWRPGLKLLDTKGRVLHEWQIEPGQIFSGWYAVQNADTLKEQSIHGTYLFPNGDLLVNVSYVGTVRLDSCSRVVWKRRTRGHHTIERAHDGTFWMPASSDEPRTNSRGHPDGFPGLDQPVYQEYLLRLNGEGDVLGRINLLDVIYENNLQRFIFRMNQSNDQDVTHLNDVEPLSPGLSDQYPLFEAGDLLVSMRDLNLVFVVDPTSRKVKWHASRPFVKQHDPDFVGKGTIGVFNNNRAGKTGNRGEVLGGSEIVTLQPHTGSVKVVFPTSRSDTFYTDIRGKWQRLENGNLLLTEAQAGRLLEVTERGRTVWKWVAKPYSETHVPIVSGGSRYSLKRSDVASWSCSPNSSEHGQKEVQS